MDLEEERISSPENTETEDEIDIQHRDTKPEDKEPFHKANEALIELNKAIHMKNKRVCYDIDDLQNKIKDLTNLIRPVDVADCNAQNPREPRESSDENNKTEEITDESTRINDTKKLLDFWENKETTDQDSNRASEKTDHEVTTLKDNNTKKLLDFWKQNEMLGQDINRVPKGRVTHKSTRAKNNTQTLLDFWKQNKNHVPERKTHQQSTVEIKNNNTLKYLYETAEIMKESSTDNKENFAQKRDFWKQMETSELDTMTMEKNERLKLPTMEDKETQAAVTEEDYKLLLQEVVMVNEQRSQLEEKLTQAQRDREALMVELDEMIKKTKMNQVALDKEREILEQEYNIVSKQKDNERLQKEVEELQMQLQEEKRLRSIKEDEATSHTNEETPRGGVELEEVVDSVDELQEENLQEEVQTLNEKPEEFQSMLESSSSEETRPRRSSWMRFIRFSARLFRRTTT